MNDTAIYAYCFTSGVPSFSAPPMGIDNKNPVYVIGYEGLNAVVSNVSPDEFGEPSLEVKFKDLHWLATMAKNHESIIEQIMSCNTIAPLRFCTIYKSPERIIELLRTHYKELIAFLDKIKDKAEWTVKVYYDYTLISKYTTSRNKEVKQMTEKMPETEGERYFHQKRLNTLIKDIVARHLAAVADDIFEGLKTYACVGRALNSGTSVNGRDVLLNAAFMVSKECVADFRMGVDTLAGVYKPMGVFFEMNGPWPLYNFCPSIG